MAIKDSLLPEFDVEMAGARKTLERMPEGKTDWKPHPKSMTLGRLAGHLGEMPVWAAMTLTRDSIDIAPTSGPAMEANIAKSRESNLAYFDKGLAEARAALNNMTDEQFLRPWSLMGGGQVIFTMPKIAVFRSLVMNHLIHHRAQLGVYLRMNDVPVPSLYGPSADEGKM